MGLLERRYDLSGRPLKRTSKAVIPVVAGVVIREGRVLVALRPAGVHLAGLWEFPGGKVQGGESEVQALARELLEELGIRVRVGACLGRVTHAYPEKTVALAFFACTLEEGEPRAIEVEALRWVDHLELCRLSMPPADAPIIEVLRDHLS